MPQWGMEHATQECALTRSRTSNLWLCGMMPNQLSYTVQGNAYAFFTDDVWVHMQMTTGPQKSSRRWKYIVWSKIHIQVHIWPNSQVSLYGN